MSTPIPPPPSEQPKRRPWVARHKILTGLGVVIVLAIIGGISSGGGGSTPSTNSDLTTATSATTTDATTTNTTQAAATGHNPKTDVTITDCSRDNAGYATSHVKIVNHSSKASDYFVTVAIESSDGATQIGTGNATVQALAPGQSTVQEANSLQSVAAGKDFTCRVVDVTRFASN